MYIHMASRSLSTAVIAASLLLTSNSALSQGALEEVTVTAQRRAENLQDVPFTVSAFTADTLQNLGIFDTDSLSEVVPGLQMSRRTGSSVPFLRGVGTANTSAGDEASVATYVDDVYIMSMLSAPQSFNNIERIEVLKGPQGTLFGRNATGGLLHIITKDPGYETSGSLALSYDNYDTTGIRFYGTTGLGDSLAADISVYSSDQDKGWGKNRFDGEDIGITDTESYRTKWLWDIGQDTQLRFSADYTDVESNTSIARQPEPGTIGADGQVIYGDCIAGGGGEAQCVAAARQGATTYSGDWWDVDNDATPVYEAEQWGASVKLNHSFDSIDFVSITAYRESDELQVIDQDATPAYLIVGPLSTDNQIFTQEFQFLYSGDSFSGIAGLYYLNSTAEYNPLEISGAGLAALSPIVQTFFAYPSQDTESWSVFAEGTYSLTDTTSVTAGLRYTEDERELSYYRYAVTTVGVIEFESPSDPVEDKESWSEPTWRLSLDHRFTDDVMAYVSYSRGFKSGVYNLASMLALEPRFGPVDPEILDAYEIGVKADLFDQRVRLNAALFYYEYDDIQLIRIQDGGTTLLNAAEAEITGAELDVTAWATERLELRLALSVLDAEFTDFPNAPGMQPLPIGGNQEIVIDATGNNIARTPDATVNLSATYRLPTDFGEWSFTGNYYYNDGFYWEPENRQEQDSYEVVNGEIAWLSNDQTWRVRIYGRNLLDEEYSLYTGTSTFGDAVTGAAPRTVGAEVEFNF